MKRMILASTHSDFLKKHDIETCGEGNIGFSETEQKYYGWSHRACYGFGIGHVCKEGDCGVSEKGPIRPGFKCKTLEDCKKVAKAFANAVS